ncbi:hypothetical protein SVIOM74S_03144 [Streptomyces violarus]
MTHPRSTRAARTDGPQDDTPAHGDTAARDAQGAESAAARDAQAPEDANPLATTDTPSTPNTPSTHTTHTTQPTLDTALTSSSAGFGRHLTTHRVYKPDWADPERLDHTTALARVLAGLLPDDVGDGTISTLPLAWRTAYDDERAESARTALLILAERLDAIEELTGRSIRVGLEPEPGCVVETTRDAIAPLTAIGHDRIGICVDTCHLATSFEDPHTALDALTEARVPVVKSQLSAALHAEHPHLPEVREALAAFAEPRFLHQTRTATAAGLRATDDLGEAIAGHALPDGAPWRAHFHVPLHAAPAAPLTSTLPVLKTALTRLVGGPAPLTRHLEVETYTWQALPPELRPRGRSQLAEGIAAELTLARDLLTDLGLKELP